VIPFDKDYRRTLRFDLTLERKFGKLIWKLNIIGDEGKSMAGLALQRAGLVETGERIRLKGVPELQEESRFGR